VARAALDLGFYISFSGILTFKNAQDLRDIAARMPLDRILIETDSPYLAPAPHRGKTNNPSYVPFVAKQIAEIKGMNSQILNLLGKSGIKSMDELAETEQEEFMEIVKKLHVPERIISHILTVARQINNKNNK
jgi:TatD family hydrolase